MPQKSKKISISVAPSTYRRLEELATELNFVTESENPNVSRLIRDGFIRFFLSLDRMDGMTEYKEKTGRKTPDIIRSATYQTVKPEESPKRYSERGRG